MNTQDILTQEIAKAIEAFEAQPVTYPSKERLAECRAAFVAAWLESAGKYYERFPALSAATQGA